MESFNESKVEETGSSCGKPKRGKMFDILRMQTGAQREEELRKPLLPEEASTKAKGVLLSHLSEKPQHSGIQGRSSDIWQALKEKSGFTEGSSSRKADVGREI